jgi:hypothetical protein
MSETRVDPDTGSTLVPVDHDPFTETEPQGYFGKIASDLSDFWQQPVEHVKQRLADIGQSFSDVAQSGLQRQAELTGGDYSNQPLIGANPWEHSPQIEQYGGALVPSPPRPWNLIPVDHDPFQGGIIKGQ